MKIKLTQTSILFDYKEINRELEEKKTAGGIILPETVKESELLPAPIFTIKEVGPDCKQVKGGDKVVLNHNARPIPLMFKDGQYVIYKEHDIIAIIE